MYQTYFDKLLVGDLHFKNNHLPFDFTLWGWITIKIKRMSLNVKSISKAQQILHLTHQTADKTPARQQGNHSRPEPVASCGHPHTQPFTRQTAQRLLPAGKCLRTSWLDSAAGPRAPAAPRLPDRAPPCRQKQCWSCSGTLSLRISARWTSGQDCSHSPGPRSCRWSRCSAGTRRRCGTPARGTRNASPDCWQVWCSCLAPTLGHSWFGLHTIPHCDCSLRPGAFHLRRKDQVRHISFKGFIQVHLFLYN